MAEDGGKLYITISDKRGGETPTPTPTPNGGGKDKEKDSDTLGRYLEHEMFHLVKQQATQAVNFALSNIGNFTGDYITQTKVSETKAMVSGIIGIGTAAAAGAKMTGSWVGAVVGLAVGVVSTTSNMVFRDIELRNTTSKQNYEIAQLRERAGLNTTKDGSRGTEN